MIWSGSRLVARNISFSLTTPQFIDESKDVTRRIGWTFLKSDDILCAVEKGQGLKRGEKIKRLGMIRVVDARREPLDSIADPMLYGADELRREGFPNMTAHEFVAFFCKGHNGCFHYTVITRIEFKRIAS